jgi:SAM-dependent methyltransferase
MLSYDEHVARVQNKHQYPEINLNRDLRALVDCCNAGDRVLDIACGSGRVIVALKEKGCSVRGIDLSPGAVAAVRSKGFDAIEGNVDTFENNETVRDFLLAPADVVVFSKCLNYLREKNVLMKRLKVKTILIHQNNPGYWRSVLRSKFGRAQSQYLAEELPYISANGEHLKHADARTVKRWGESFGYRGTFVRGGNLFAGAYLLKLERV